MLRRRPCCLQVAIEKEGIESAFWSYVFAEFGESTLWTSLRLQNERLLRMGKGRRALAGIPWESHGGGIRRCRYGSARSAREAAG